MPLFVIPFPAFDPVLVHLGPFAIRWYALAYIVGILLGWALCPRLDPRQCAVGRQCLNGADDRRSTSTISCCG